ncbi:MAG: aminoacyl-tRNA hydrolase [Vicinamibacterales bacterium]
MKLVVGLGNPGSQYRETRHNVGFLVIDELARRWRVEQWRELFDALTAKTIFGEGPVLLAKPMTYMNLSGYSVAGLAGFYKIEPADVFIISDDAVLPLARLRARREGADGGHNGLKSVIGSLGTTAFPRLRVGVGRGEGERELADHVLERFPADERERVSAAVLRAADATEMFLREGIERVMNAFNAAETQDPEPAA